MNWKVSLMSPLKTEAEWLGHQNSAIGLKNTNVLVNELIDVNVLVNENDVNNCDYFLRDIASFSFI